MKPMRANQIVSGLALVIFGTGLATFLGTPIEGDPLRSRLDDLPVPVNGDDGVRGGLEDGGLA